MSEYRQGAPIYLQIVEEMLSKIVSGQWPPGGKVQTVRDLAVAFSVNPNTMQRALSELERTGLIITERTTGRFVTEDNALIAVARREKAQLELTAFLKRMKELGFERAEIVRMLEEEKNKDE